MSPHDHFYTALVSSIMCHQNSVVSVTGEYIWQAKEVTVLNFMSRQSCTKKKKHNKKFRHSTTCEWGQKMCIF